MTEYINRRPNELLHKIFSALPLTEVIPLELVCKKWKWIQELVLVRVHAVSGCDFDFVWEYPDFYWLLFYRPLNFDAISFTPKRKDSLVRPRDHMLTSIDFFLRKMPNVTCLSLYGLNINFETVQLLCNTWNNLQELNLFPLDTNTFNNDRFCRLMMQMKSLRRLAMQTFQDQETLFDLTIFSQLESLFFENQFLENFNIDQVIRHLGFNIQSIGLVNVFHRTQELEGLKQFLLNDTGHLASTLSTKVINLTIQMDGPQDDQLTVDLPLLDFISNTFHSVTHLDIHLHWGIFFEEILEPLSKLTQLSHLRLDVANAIVRPLLFELPNEDFNDGRTVLHSVKKLHLSIDHTGAPTLLFYSIYFPCVFPGLVEWRFENSGIMYLCDCEPDHDKDNIFDGIKCRRCPTNLFSFFQNDFTKLIHVYRNNHLVFDRNNPDLHAFKDRLARYGTSINVRPNRI